MTTDITYVLIKRMMLLLAVLPGLFIAGCQEEEPLEAFFEEEELLISDYLQENSEKYSSLLEVLEITELKNTLNAYGHYTFFAPDNQAFSEFCEQNGKSAVSDFSKEYLATLVRYHLLDVEMESAYFRDGAIPDTTYSGDYLVITFSEGGLETIHVNDALITERDILVENGVLHRINKVLAPVVGSVYHRIDEAEGYEIFTRALEISGLSDSLKIIEIDLNEDIFIRSRFTIFAEPDRVYNDAGIATAEDLVAKYSDTGDPDSREDGFYQYVAYHIVPGLLYLNALDSFNYPTLAENMLLNIRLGEEIYLNWHTEDKDGTAVEKYIELDETASNHQAKNGVFHSLNGILEPWVPEPVRILIDLTDYQGISIGQTYTEKDLEDISGIISENTGIYFRNSILGDGETNLQTTSDRIGWVVEFQLPVILKGQYDIELYWPSHPSHSNWVQTFWDGSRLGDPFSMVHQKRWPGMEWLREYNTSQWIARLLLTDTETHQLKFIALQDGFGNFDYLVLTPVEDE